MGRLGEALRVVRSFRPPGVRIESSETAVWRACGGPIDDVAGLLSVLQDAGLIMERAGHLTLTKSGRVVATQDHQHNGRLMATSLIESGLFSYQTKELLALVESAEGGALVCEFADAMDSSPQLTGVLLRWSGTRVEGKLLISPELSRLLVESAELSSPPQLRDDPRKELGDRAEAYSVRFLRLRAQDQAKIRWVARDNETLGYDIEDENEDHLIEVKGSVSTEVQFYLSANEFSVMHDNPDRYFIHFWGGIDLSKPRQREYGQLLEAGYPKVIDGLPARLSDGEYEATPRVYKVTKQET